MITQLCVTMYGLNTIENTVSNKMSESTFNDSTVLVYEARMPMIVTALNKDI